MEHISWRVEPQNNGITVEGFLRGIHKMSHRVLAELKRTEGGITVNGRPARSIDRVYALDTVEVRLEERGEVQLPVHGLPLTVVYEDEHYLICDKPAGMAVHPSLRYYDDTLANAVAAYYCDSGGNRPFRPINRLDKDTSGLVLVAKNRYAACRCAKAADKRYYCVARGIIEGDGTVDEPISRDGINGGRRSVGGVGDRAVTHYHVLHTGSGVTQLAVTLETGRTHQIRAHMAHIGHPLVGDVLYGGGDGTLARQALHCYKMSLVDPITGAKIDVSSPLPEDIAAYLKSIGEQPVITETVP